MAQLEPNSYSCSVTPKAGNVQEDFTSVGKPEQQSESASHGMFPGPQEATNDRPGGAELVSGIDKVGSFSTLDYQQQATPPGGRKRQSSPSPAQRQNPSPQLQPLEPHRPASPTAAPAAQQEQPPPNAPGPQPTAQDNHHDESSESSSENDLLLPEHNTGTRNQQNGDARNQQNAGTRNRRKQLSFILICAIITVCFLAGSAISVAFFGTRYNTTPSAHQSLTMIQQGDIIILPIEDNYCVSSERVTSLNITEVLPPYAIKTLALYKHLGDRSSLRNISSIPVMISTELELTCGEILRTIYAASYASVSFVVQILNIAPLNGFTSDDGSLTLYILGSDEDAECFDEQGKNCHYIRRLSLNTKNGSKSVAYYQGFKPGYYLLYLLPQNVDITVAYNYTFQFDTFNPDDFTQPVCTIRAGNECDNITLRQNEGTVCFIASAVPTGSDQFFNLSTRVLYRPLHLHDPTTKTLLAFGVTFFLITLISAMVLLVALHGYKYQ